MCSQFSTSGHLIFDPIFCPRLFVDSSGRQMKRIRRSSWEYWSTIIVVRELSLQDSLSVPTQGRRHASNLTQFSTKSHFKCPAIVSEAACDYAKSIRSSDQIFCHA